MPAAHVTRTPAGAHGGPVLDSLGDTSIVSCCALFIPATARSEGSRLLVHNFHQVSFLILPRTYSESLAAGVRPDSMLVRKIDRASSRELLDLRRPTKLPSGKPFERKRMTPLTSTIADLTAAKLIAYVPPPTPGIPLVAPSTDAAVYMANPSYLKQLNQQAFQRYAIDQPNANAAARFDFACKTWEQSGKNPTAIPQWPVYSYLDQRAFDEWWNVLNSNLGQDAPPLFFIKLLPAPPPVQLVAADRPRRPRRLTMDLSAPRCRTIRACSMHHPTIVTRTDTFMPVPRASIKSTYIRTRLHPGMYASFGWNSRPQHLISRRQEPDLFVRNLACLCPRWGASNPNRPVQPNSRCVRAVNWLSTVHVSPGVEPVFTPGFRRHEFC